MDFYLKDLLESCRETVNKATHEHYAGEFRSGAKPNYAPKAKPQESGKFDHAPGVGKVLTVFDGHGSDGGKGYALFKTVKHVENDHPLAAKHVKGLKARDHFRVPHSEFKTNPQDLKVGAQTAVIGTLTRYTRKDGSHDYAMVNVHAHQ